MKILSSLLIPAMLFAGELRIANYNVENLFDLNNDGGEYREYIPNNKHKWNKKVYKIKLENISRVIYDLKADIVALQEIENEVSLNDLRATLNQIGLKYPYYAIADDKKTTVKCAILSKYPIKNKKNVTVGSRYTKYRDILEVSIDINNKDLKVLINHWKSKYAPEGDRLIYALSLKKRIEELKDNEYILIGDFNSNYNEFETFIKKLKLNNTDGRTGINHKLQTIKNGKLITLKDIQDEKNRDYLYNLWLELEDKERYSHIFYDEYETLDNIIIPYTLVDNKNIEYIKNSFNKFSPSYLFDDKNKILRWKISNKGKGKHEGIGYSDHLPIYADFKIKD